jgi:type VI protein secretion system component Hcp
MAYTISIDFQGAGKAPTIQVEALSVAWGFEQPVNSAGTAPSEGNAEFQAVHFTKDIDATSAILFENLEERVRFASADILLKDSSKLVAHVELSDVYITSIEDSASTGDEPPVEDVGLTYGKFAWASTAAGGTTIKSLIP